MTFFVGTGPSELHAHIDLDHRITAHHGNTQRPTTHVLDVTHDHGHWAVLANVSLDTIGEENA
ncbi:hypothetical protein [Dietzia cinnamea]|uniref:hypothetical protein n=1 Tax=Dietzia cinnamea TaxID=321318 RepID=UPI0007741ADE|nr:hypothetical protein [Dietzia cinnamea]